MFKQKRLNKKVGKYYDENYEFYSTGWSEDYIHYGFWYEDTQTHIESLLNTVKDVVQFLDITKGDKVLDAGCGTGGATRYIVENYNVEAIGITVSQKQLEYAKRMSKNIKNKLLINYCNEDYCDTSFQRETFNKIFAIESSCYAVKKKEFIKESYRLLKRGGIIVVCDAFLTKNILEKDKKRIYNEWLEGWLVPNLSTLDKFNSYLIDAGFININFINKTDLIKKSSEIIFESAKNDIHEKFILSSYNKIPFTQLKHIVSSYRQKDCIDKGIWSYGIFTAIKK